MDVKSKAMALVSMILLIYLLFTWFFPALNGTAGLNNTTTLWLAGTNYTWFAPILAIIILFVIIMWILGFL